MILCSTPKRLESMWRSFSSICSTQTGPRIARKIATPGTIRRRNCWCINSKSLGSWISQQDIYININWQRMLVFFFLWSICVNNDMTNVLWCIFIYVKADYDSSISMQFVIAINNYIIISKTRRLKKMYISTLCENKSGVKIFEHQLIFYVGTSEYSP